MISLTAILGHASKAFSPSCSFPCAGVTTTIGGNPAALISEIGFAISLDGMLAQISDAVQRYCSGGYTARVLVGAFDDGPRLFLIASDADKISPDRLPFEPLELGHMASSGTNLPEYAEMIDRGFSEASVERFIAAQIAAGMDWDGMPVHLRGRRDWMSGKLTCATVSAAGVAFDVVREIDRAAA